MTSKGKSQTNSVEISGSFTFMGLAINGLVEPDAIDDFVGAWHNHINNESNLAIDEYLGMSIEEYASWVEKPDSLLTIISEAKQRQSLK